MNYLQGDDKVYNRYGQNEFRYTRYGRHGGWRATMHLINHWTGELD